MNTGVTFAHFHAFGYILVERDRLKSLDNGYARALDASFNIFGLIRSGPDALLVSSVGKYTVHIKFRYCYLFEHIFTILV